MADSDNSDNQGSEAPTQRRRDEARNDGQVVQSQDLSAAMGMLTGFLILMWFGDPVGQRLLGSIRIWFRDAPEIDWTDQHTILGARWLSSELFGACGILVIVVSLVALALGFLQVGFTVSWKPLAANWSKLSPVRGMQRLFSMESAIRGTLGALKVTGLLLISGTVIWWRQAELRPENFGSLADVMQFGWKFGLTIGTALAGLVLCLGAVDFSAKWLRNEQKLKMTREEIKREQKDDLGDPTLKVAMRRRQREAIRQRSVAEVPQATLILTNPTHLAIAIRYDRKTMSAPRVVAKGAGEFAKNIVKIARQHKVPVVERKPLARALYKSVKTGQEIPSEFFRAIAGILAHIYRIRRSAA